MSTALRHSLPSRVCRAPSVCPPLSRTQVWGRAGLTRACPPQLSLWQAHTDGGRAAVCVVVGSRKGCGTGSTVEAGGALRAGLWMKSRPPRQKDVKGPGEAVPGGGARPGGRGPW